MLNFKKWNIANSENYRLLSEKYSVCSLSSKVAASRLNLISETELFSSENLIRSPFDLIDMDRAVDRINDALENDEKIVVYGDYDADGVTATVILTSFLEAMGADVSFYIPSREDEGYGLNKQAIGKLCDDGCNLIITVDNGIAAIDEIEFAKSLGIDVVVTDHHMPQGKIPDCIVVDPHREDCPSKFKEICGAFVAFKLVAALDGGDYDGAFMQYGELVALATIADIVPLVDENRTVARLGIGKMKTTDNLGLCTLINAALSEEAVIDSNLVTYSIIPRINAAGRMGDAKRAAQLLLSEDEAEAECLADELCRDNDKRKNIETDILSEIDEMAVSQPHIFSQRIVVVCGKGWHHGVLGIVASKLVEKTGKPAIVLSEEDAVASGSGRSVEGFNLFEALCSCSEVFERFGGHSLAAGVTVKVENVTEFRDKVNAYAAKNYPYMPVNTLSADAVISPEEITLAAVKELSMFEPFGKSNSAPVFAVLGAILISSTPVGNGKHTRLSLSYNKYNFTALYFGTLADEFSPFLQKNVDILIRLKPNVYNGIESVTIQIVDVRPSGINDEVFFKEKQLYEMAERGENISLRQAQYLMPSREEAVELYKILKKNSPYNFGEDMLWWQLSGKINRAKLSVILKAFRERELADIRDGRIEILEAKQKQDLFGCDILKNILEHLSN